MSTTCERSFTSLSAWMDGVAPSIEVEHLKAHLEHCVSCQEQYSQWLVLRTLIPPAMEPVVATEFASRTAEGIHKVVSLEKARRPGNVLAEFARVLWGGLAWGLMGATWAGMRVSQRLGSFLAEEPGHAMSAGSWAEVQKYGRHIPEWLCDWRPGSLLMLVTGLFMLRPRTFWRRLRSSDPMDVGSVVSFGLGTVLVGVGTALPNLAVGLDGRMVTVLAVWTILCMAMTGAVTVFRCSRSLVNSAWMLIGCIIISMAVEPVVSPVLVSHYVPGSSVEAYHSQDEQVAEQRDLAGHGAPISMDYPFGTRLTLFENTLPDWVSNRFEAVHEILSPGSWWWSEVIFVGGLGCLAALLLAGPLHGDVRLPRAIVAISVIAVVGIGGPWTWWLAHTLETTGLGRPNLAMSLAQKPHPEQERTVVALTGQTNGQLQVYGYPLPGLIDALLHAPTPDQSTQAGRSDTLARWKLERARALLEWDPAAWEEAEAHVLESQRGIDDYALVDMLHDTAPLVFTGKSDVQYGHWWSTADLKSVEIQYRPMVERLLLGRKLWWPSGIYRNPHKTFTVRGTIYLNGAPAANLPVRLYRLGYNESSLDFAWGEVLGSVRQCFEEDSEVHFPARVTRTDTEGRFVFVNPTPDKYMPVIMLPGHWSQATTHDALRDAHVEVRDDDVDLGRFNVEVAK